MSGSDHRAPRQQYDGDPSGTERMNYEEALGYLYSFADFERAPPRDRKPFRLGPFRMLLRRIGDPQTRYPCVHVAGTKGKGSVAAMIERVLREAGYVTGLYTSPHLEDVRERIQVSGRWIPRASFSRGLAILRGVVDPSTIGGYRTTFELLTALAFHEFAEQAVDVAVVETGLGGLLDSTNVIRPAVAVITPVFVEHARILGRTLRQVAYQKAGIIKRGAPVVSARQNPSVRDVIEQRCESVDSPLTLVGRDVRVRFRSADKQGQWLDIDTPRVRHRELRLALHGRRGRGRGRGGARGRGLLCTWRGGADRTRGSPVARAAGDSAGQSQGSSRRSAYALVAVNAVPVPWRGGVASASRPTGGGVRCQQRQTVRHDACSGATHGAARHPDEVKSPQGCIGV
jgi:hypothetical protein